MSANDKCPAHYTNEGEQHWDRAWRLYGRGYFVGAATKYAERYHKKNGLDDLKKAIHFLEKLYELEKAAADGTGPLGAEGAQPSLSARDEAADLRALVNGMANRIAAQSDLLSRNAERNGTPAAPTLDFMAAVEEGKQRWVQALENRGIQVRTPHENIHGYVVREGVMWCPHCGCPHDSFDPFAPGLTCAQCKRLLTTFEQVEECDQCNGTGVVIGEWDTIPTPCPKCQDSCEG